jgi:hypothetical protein
MRQQRRRIVVLCALLAGCSTRPELLERQPASPLAQACPLELLKLLKPDERLARNLEGWRESLPGLYPHLSADAIKQKTTTASSAFRFFRAFGPLFYERIVRDPAHQQLFSRLKAFKGWMMGDAHPENFGILLARDGSARFAANDIDDAGPGPLYLDVLRYLSSARYVPDAPDAGSLLKAYRRGLEGKDGDWGDAVAWMLRKSEDRGFNPRKNAFDEESGRLLRNRERVELANQETRADLERRVRRHYGPGAQVVDAVEYLRDWGGSGFQKRYVVLIQFPREDRAWTDEGRVVVEFKEMVEPATRLLGGAREPRLERRVERTYALFKSDGRALSPFYDTTHFEDRGFLMRPRYDGERGFDLTDWEGDDRRGLLRDQMRLLGLMHRKELGAAEAARFSVATESLSDEAWAREARHLHALFTQMYREASP